MPMDPDEYYFRLARTIEKTPDLSVSDAVTEQWLGDAFALVEIGGNIPDTAEMRSSVWYLFQKGHEKTSQRSISTVLYRCLARAALQKSDRVGEFLPVDSPFRAQQAVAKILSSARRELLIVDPYMDANTLADFASTATEGVLIRLLADARTVKPALASAARRWLAEFREKRPLEIRLVAPNGLHDRLIIVDSTEVWLVSQSFNALAARSPATLIKAQEPVSGAKLEAYADYWREAQPVQGDQ